MHTFTIRPVLWTHKPNKDGDCPLMIAVTIRRKRSYIKTSYRIKEDQWNGKEIIHRNNAGMANAAIRKQIAEIEKEIISRQLEGKIVTAQAIKISPTRNFYKFVKEVKGDTIADRKEANRILAIFAGGLCLDEIDLAAIRKYAQKQKDRGLAHNTIHTSLKWFRRVMTLARKEGLIKSNPFDEYDMPRYIQSERFFLSPEERAAWFKEWEKGTFSGSLYTTLTYFLIGVFTGLRHSDWHKAPERVHGKFLRLRAKKNNEWVVLPIGKSLEKLLKVAGDLRAPFSGDKSREHLKIISGILKCNMNVTTHVARHSFGAMCAQLKLPKSVTAELMGITVQTVEVYYHLTGENIADQAKALRGV